MAGFVPKWETTTKPTPETELAYAQNSKNAVGNEAALAYRGDNNEQKTAAEYSFADILDVINPLQHIPLLNHIYRGITGDSIKPSSKVLGGAVFGGPLGAASGLIDAVAVNETGRNLGENAMKIAFNRPEQSPDNKPAAAQNTPEVRLANAVQEIKTPYDSDMTLALMSFSDLKTPQTQPKPETQPQKRHTGGLYDL